MKLFKRIAIAVAGGLVILLGILLIAVPVPGLATILIPAGLAILALEFDWAQRWLVHLRQWLAQLRRKKTPEAPPTNEPLAK